MLKSESIFGILFNPTNLHYIAKKVRYYKIRNPSREHGSFSFTILMHIQLFTFQRNIQKIHCQGFEGRSASLTLISMFNFSLICLCNLPVLSAVNCAQFCAFSFFVSTNLNYLSKKTDTNKIHNTDRN